MPYASLPGDGTTTTYTQATGPYRYTRVVTVMEPVANRYKTVKIIITPANTKYKPDTVNFTRTNARVPLMLCTTCVNTTP
jgi:hypothetical protein